MVLPLITGSFMDIHHVNYWDAQYWIDQCREWKDENWAGLITDMHDAGMDTVLILNCAFWGRPLYPANPITVGIQLPMGSRDPLGCILRRADDEGMDVYAGLGFFGRCSLCFNSDLTPQHDQWLVNMAEDILEKYGRHKSFKGFYLSNEISAVKQGGLFIEKEFQDTCEFVRLLRRRIGGLKLVTSPDNLKKPRPEQLHNLTEQLRQMNIDIFAYQDHAGFGWDYREAAEGFKMISGIHHSLKQQLWVNCELFSFDQRPDGRKICIPADFSRIRDQLQIAAQIADKIICYQYQGIMNRWSETVNIGHRDSDKRYGEYMQYRNEIIGCQSGRSAT